MNKSRDIWCSSENGGKTWRSWMLSGAMPQRTMGACDTSAIKRNVALAEHYRVNGTPAIVFEDGSRFAGAADLDKLSKKPRAESRRGGGRHPRRRRRRRRRADRRIRRLRRQWPPTSKPALRPGGLPAA